MGELYLSVKQRDFIKELMNIGAGNALTVLEQLLKCDLEMKEPVIHMLEPQEVSTILGDPSMATVSVRMCMIGDIEGEMFLIVPNEHLNTLASVAERAMIETKRKFDISVLTDIADAVVNAYLFAVHEFCTLNINHTVPVVRSDMFQALLDESVTALAGEARKMILVENEFLATRKKIKTCLLVIPSLRSVGILADSMEAARAVYEKD